MVAGEASGDLLAGLLMGGLRARWPALAAAGIGGPRMAAQGFDAWWPSDKLAVHGYVEALRHYREIAGIRDRLAERLLRERPELFIGVDAPDFNLGLERKLKRRGVRTIQFVSPSVWAWRRERLQSIGDSVNRMLVLFPFEPRLYEDAGIPVTYVGHPMAQEAATHATRRETRDLLRIRPAAPVFALLPGSRMSEIEMHAGLVLETAAWLAEGREDVQFLVPFATRATRDAFEEAMHRTGHANLPITLLYGHAEDALRAADVAVVASGTATLEAALARCPHVIFYRVTRLTAWMVARKLLLPYVGLPNVLAGRFVVPELLQTQATPRNLAQAALNLFDDTVTRRRLEALFAGFANELKADTGALAGEAVAHELAQAGIAC